MTQESGIDDGYPVLPLYTCITENCLAFLRQASQAGISCDAEKAVAIGSTIGTHVGPGAFGLAYRKSVISIRSRGRLLGNNPPPHKKLHYGILTRRIRSCFFL